jgi:hypothetical protein
MFRLVEKLVRRYFVGANVIKHFMGVSYEFL